MKNLLIFLFAIFPFGVFADETFIFSSEKEDTPWHGVFEGVYSIVTADGEEASSSPKPFKLFFQDRGSNGVLNMAFIDDQNRLRAVITNLHLRENYSPPTITSERFYLPPIFSAPVEFEATFTEGGFDEELISGSITTYSLSLEEEPSVDMKYIFKAGRLPQ
ncbi:MAG: hypothetical protein AAGJ81_13680 [Verrucomicrobiota bacterium]